QAGHGAPWWRCSALKPRRIVRRSPGTPGRGPAAPRPADGAGGGGSTGAWVGGAVQRRAVRVEWAVSPLYLYRTLRLGTKGITMAVARTGAAAPSQTRTPALLTSALAAAALALGGLA